VYCAECSTERTERDIISVEQEILKGAEAAAARGARYVDHRSLKTLNGAKEAEGTNEKEKGEVMSVAARLG
jgi:hypothetical protein